MKFADIKIGVKIIGGYLAICLIIFLTGLVGYQGMNSEKKAASVVDATLGMMLAARTDMHMIMELIASSSVEELEGVWQEHLLAVEDFELFLTGISQGAETEMGLISPAEDPQLLEKTGEADKLHNDHFLPAIEKIYSLTKNDFELAERHKAAMTRFESDFDAIIALAETFEVKTKERINGKLAAGDGDQAIISTENTWADMAMEIKATLAMTRIAIEEYAQSFDADTLPQIETEYRNEIARFDTWVNALLHGGETEMGKIAPVDVPELKKLVEQIDQFHDEHFAKNGEAILPLQKEMVQAIAARNILDSEIDESGEKIMDLLQTAALITKKDMDHTVGNAVRNIFLAIVAAVVVSLLLGFVISRKITAPLHKAVSFADRLAEGDLTAKIDIEQNDEAGLLIKDLNKMAGRLHEVISNISEGMKGLAAASTKLSSTAQGLATGAEELTAQASTTAAAAEEISVNLNVVNTTAESMGSQSRTVASSAEDISSNVTSVAAAVEEMSASIREVSQNCSQAQQMAVIASEASQNASEKMNTLNRAATDIGKVIDVITEITEQTKLLALNATIEAARAGDAGKGFAVVAGEVKELAKQTAAATENIARQIRDMQGQTGGVVADIEKMTEINGKVMEYTNTIAAAVEEQTATTGEIAQTISGVAHRSGDVSNLVKGFAVSIEQELVRAIQEATTGVDEVSRNINGVNDVARESAQSASGIDNASNELAELANKLQMDVDRFRLC